MTNKVHVNFPSGEDSRMDSRLLRRLWSEGKVDAEALCWKEGMDEWLPVAEFLRAADEDESPLAEDKPGRNLPAPKRIARRANTLGMLLWAYLGAQALIIYNNIGELLYLSDASGWTSEDVSYYAPNVTFDLIALLMYVVTAIVFGMWMYRANANCHAFGARGMKYKPGWAIGYFFIPFLNLYRPCGAMQEIWKVSANPDHWHAQPGSDMVKVWWGLWLVSGAWDRLSGRVWDRADTLQELRTATMISIGAAAVSILLTLVVMRVVSGISIRQSRRIEVHPSSDDPLPEDARPTAEEADLRN